MFEVLHDRKLKTNKQMKKKNILGGVAHSHNPSTQ